MSMTGSNNVLIVLGPDAAGAAWAAASLMKKLKKESMVDPYGEPKGGQKNRRAL
jgi:hypothetical protein